MQVYNWKWLCRQTNTIQSMSVSVVTMKTHNNIPLLSLNKAWHSCLCHSDVLWWTYQCVSLPSAVIGHGDRYGSREVFSRRSTARSAAHCELRAIQAEVQCVSGCSCLDGCGRTARCMHLKLKDKEDSVHLKTNKQTENTTTGYAGLMSMLL